MEFIEEKGVDKPSVPISPPDKDEGSPDDDEPYDSKRLWIGNIDLTVPEYVILKLFEPFGEIAKLDFVYHHTGLDKGNLGYVLLCYLVALFC